MTVDQDDHWFADVGDDVDERWPWQPFLQNGGCCLPLPVWFATEGDCEQFIASIPSGVRPSIIDVDCRLTDQQIEQIKADWLARQTDRPERLP